MKIYLNSVEIKNAIARYVLQGLADNCPAIDAGKIELLSPEEKSYEAGEVRAVVEVYTEQAKTPQMACLKTK